MVEGNKKRIVPEPETPAASFCLRRRHQVRREEENEKKTRVSRLGCAIIDLMLGLKFKLGQNYLAGLVLSRASTNLKFLQGL
jgi:hypothetical protein